MTASGNFQVMWPEHRCDRCISRAYVLVIFDEDLSLMFCAHHWNRYSDELKKVAVDYVDETYLLAT